MPSRKVSGCSDYFGIHLKGKGVRVEERVSIKCRQALAQLAYQRSMGNDPSRAPSSWKFFHALENIADALAIELKGEDSGDSRLKTLLAFYDKGGNSDESKKPRRPEGVVCHISGSDGGGNANESCDNANARRR